MSRRNLQHRLGSSWSSSSLLPLSSPVPTQRPAMRFSPTMLHPDDRNRKKYPRRCSRSSAPYLIYTRVRTVRLSACTSARMRRATGVAGFRQSDDNDRNVARRQPVARRKNTTSDAEHREGVSLIHPTGQKTDATLLSASQDTTAMLFVPVILDLKDHKF